jgi:peptide chain release factor 1
MREMLEQQLARFEELDRLMLDPSVLADSSRLAAIARERGSLAKVATKYRQFKEINRQIAQTQELVHGDDPELRSLAEAELPELRQQREAIYNELLELTMQGEDAHRQRCILEIRAGTGGDEAALFARDLYEMYRKFGERRGWKFDVLDMSPTELGGFKEIILGVEGPDAYKLLQYESGGHRVQRVPQTEAKGRVHTSAATVAVLPEPEDVEVHLKPEDYRLDIFCASGPGGQHVNKTASAVRLTHYETGIVVQCQDEKSQHKNKAKALRQLKARIYEHKRAAEHQKRADQRKTLVGSGDRSQRIRTYNFPDNRITDHRINFTLYQLDSVIAGNIDPVLEALMDYDRQQQRELFGTMD